MSLVRLRRLQADFLKVQEYVRSHPRVQLVQYDGDPPERYQLRYQILSLRQKDDELIEVTPASLRLRKRALGATERRKLARDRKAAEES